MSLSRGVHRNLGPMMLMLSLTLYASLNIASAAIVVISVRRSVHVIATEGTEGDEKREKNDFCISVCIVVYEDDRDPSTQDGKFI